MNGINDYISENSHMVIYGFVRAWDTPCGGWMSTHEGVGCCAGP